MEESHIVMTPSDLLVVGSIIAAFGAATLPVRLQREIEMARRREITWIPWAERLVLCATLLSLVGVIIPLLLFEPTQLSLTTAKAATLLSVVFLAGYVPAILAHYRLMWSGGRSGPRENPEPSERFVVWITVSIGLFLSIITFFSLPVKITVGANAVGQHMRITWEAIAAFASCIAAVAAVVGLFVAGRQIRQAAVIAKSTAGLDALFRLKRSGLRRRCATSFNTQDFFCETAGPIRETMSLTS
jgi:hypothetical protein